MIDHYLASTVTTGSTCYHLLWPLQRLDNLGCFWRSLPPKLNRGQKPKTHTPWWFLIIMHPFIIYNFIVPANNKNKLHSQKYGGFQTFPFYWKRRGSSPTDRIILFLRLSTWKPSKLIFFFFTSGCFLHGAGVSWWAWGFSTDSW